MNVVGPVQVEQAIREVSERISRGVQVCDRQYRGFLDADREYDRGFAQAYMAHQGPAHEKKYAAEIATSELRAARDTADAAYRYADRQSKALQDELRALQSIGANIRNEFSVAGRGVS